MLIAALKEGNVQGNPLTRFEKLDEDNMRSPTLSEKEEAALLEASAEWMRPVIMLAIYTGARSGEINFLEWKDVDLQTMLITFKTEKARGTRQIPIIPRLVAYLEPIRKDSGPVTLAPLGNRDKLNRKEPYIPNVEVISHAFKKAARDIGRGDLRFHDLRHIAASRLHAAGAGAFDLQAFLGHKTLIITRRYTVDSVPRLRAFMERVGSETNNENGNVQKP